MRLFRGEIAVLTIEIWTRSSLLQIYTGHHPFIEAANDAAVIYRVMQGRRPALRLQSEGEPPEVPMPDHVMEVVEWCWKQQPVERPEIMDVVQIMKTWASMVTT